MEDGMLDTHTLSHRISSKRRVSFHLLGFIIYLSLSLCILTISCIFQLLSTGWYNKLHTTFLVYMYIIVCACIFQLIWHVQSNSSEFFYYHSCYVFFTLFFSWFYSFCVFFSYLYWFIRYYCYFSSRRVLRLDGKVQCYNSLLPRLDQLRSACTF